MKRILCWCMSLVIAGAAVAADYKITRGGYGSYHAQIGSFSAGGQKLEKI